MHPRESGWSCELLVQVQHDRQEEQAERSAPQGHKVTFGTVAQAMLSTISALVFNDPPVSASTPTIKPPYILQIKQRQPIAFGVLDKISGLARRFGVHYAADARTCLKSLRIRADWR